MLSTFILKCWWIVDVHLCSANTALLVLFVWKTRRFHISVITTALIQSVLSRRAIVSTELVLYTERALPWYGATLIWMVRNEDHEAKRQTTHRVRMLFYYSQFTCVFLADEDRTIAFGCGTKTPVWASPSEFQSKSWAVWLQWGSDSSTNQPKFQTCCVFWVAKLTHEKQGQNSRNAMCSRYLDWWTKEENKHWTQYTKYLKLDRYIYLVLTLRSPCLRSFLWSKCVLAKDSFTFFQCHISERDLQTHFQRTRPLSTATAHDGFGGVLQSIQNYKSIICSLSLDQVFCCCFK